MARDMNCHHIFIENITIVTNVEMMKKKEKNKKFKKTNLKRRKL